MTYYRLTSHVQTVWGGAVLRGSGPAVERGAWESLQPSFDPLFGLF